MSIPLPPLPEHLHHPELQKLDAFTREQLRARDQEIVRCVLQAAAKVCDEIRHPWGYSAETADWTRGTDHCADAIRALEFHHE